VARIFITGSSDGLGLMAARLLIDQGHDVVLHGRNEGRSRDALAAAGGAKGVVSGDLSTIAGARIVADQVNKLGRFDAVIHNAGIGYREGRVETEPGVPAIFAVNVLAPYILTALIEKPDRLVYLSSGTHHGVRLRMDDLLWTRRSWSGFSAYAESKLLRCFARLCRRSPLERRQIQRAGAWMGSDKDGRPFSTGRSSSGVRNPGVACHE
jgi:NAD(P)-dependent dehydrogenase (short-subunit alcohol dehydrogenase family)